MQYADDRPPPRHTDRAYREQMDSLLTQAAALARAHGLLRFDWTAEGVDYAGRLVRHRIKFDGYVKRESHD